MLKIMKGEEGEEGGGEDQKISKNVRSDFFIVFHTVFFLVLILILKWKDKDMWKN